MSQPRARTSTEMRFAISLQACAKCGTRIDPDALTYWAADNSCAYTGRCGKCFEPCSFRYLTEGDPVQAPCPRGELGGPQPSQIIAMEQFAAEIERMQLRVTEDPSKLDLQPWRASRDANTRLLVAIAELLKFQPPDAARYEQLRNAHLAIQQRIIDDLPRVSALEAARPPRRQKTAGAPLTCLAAGPDGVGVGAQNGRVYLIDPLAGDVQQVLETGGPVSRLRWSRKSLLIGMLDGRVLVNNAAVKTGHGTLRGLAVRNDAFATSGADGAVRIWDLASGRLKLELRAGNAAAMAVGFAVGSIVAGYADGTFVAWTEDGKEIVASGEVTRAVSCLAVHPSGKSVLFGAERGGIQEVIVAKADDWVGGTTWADIPSPIAVNGLDFAPDGRFVAALSDDTAMVFASTNDEIGDCLGEPFYWREPKPAWNQSFIVSGACFVRDSDLVATCHFDGTLRLWRGTALVDTIVPG